MRGPRSCFNLWRWFFVVQPLISLSLNFLKCITFGLWRIYRNLWPADPLFNRNLRRQFRVFFQEVFLQVIDEIWGRNTLKSKVRKVFTQESIKLIASEGFF